jgi:hypothetical protein
MIRIDRENAPEYRTQFLMQQGVYVPLPSGGGTTGGGTKVKNFVCSLLGISGDVYATEMGSVFLNGRVVDDGDEVTIRAGDTLALSGAMPGLVGGMLRSGSPLRRMRQTVTAGDTSNDSNTVETQTEGIHSESATIRLKLYNTVLHSYKDSLLETGFYITERQADDQR